MGFAKFSSEYVVQLVRIFDFDGDGRIDLPEFATVVSFLVDGLAQQT